MPGAPFGSPGPYGQQSPYGQPGQYGPPPYSGQPGQYGPPGPYAQPYGQQPQKSSKVMIIVLAVAGVVVLGGLAVALVVLLLNRQDGVTATVGTPTASATPSDSSGPSPSSPGGGTATGSSGGAIPPPTVQPTGLGDDPVWNRLARECFDGRMLSCDALFAGTSSDESLSAYTHYADTCAGRQPEGTRVYCSVAFPG